MSRLIINSIADTDSYKLSHYRQYPLNVRYISSYIESRGVSKDLVGMDSTPEIVFFGLQKFLMDLEPITLGDISEMEDIATLHGLPFNKEGWKLIWSKYGGNLPIRIEALPEGTVHGFGIPQVQIINTDASFPWLSSYMETSLLSAIWYPSTVATLSREVKKLIMSYLKFTDPDMAESLIDLKLHDFGARGCTCQEQRILGGMAHLVNFKGTDTLAGIIGARRYYKEEMAGFSIPAAEHSTITAWGKENEKDAFSNMLSQFANPNMLVAVVSDSYNIFNAIDNLWGKELKQKVIESGATIVIRPDSGNPTEMVMYALNSLGKNFGTTVNGNGFKVLHPSIRIIQGDGVNYFSIREILKTMVNEGWSIQNITFGMGGALLQRVDRDTLKYAQKASAKYDTTGWVDIYKDPVSDKGKASKRGIQIVVKEGTQFKAKKLDDSTIYEKNYLSAVYDTGEILEKHTFSEIRERARI